MQESGERGDAAFLENCEPGVCRECRKNILGKFREKFSVKLF